MTSKMGDVAMDLAGAAETVKEWWSKLYAQYHEKGWGAESILLEKLVYLFHLDYDSTSDYVRQFRSLSQRLSTMWRVCENFVASLSTI